MQVLPPLVDVIPEARLNLVIYYLQQGKYTFSGSFIASGLTLIHLISTYSILLFLCSKCNLFHFLFCCKIGEVKIPMACREGL